MNRPSLTQEPKINSYNLRIFLLLFVFTVFLLFVAARLFNLQILSRGYYLTLASNQHKTELSIVPSRGEIYLTAVNGSQVLAATNITKNMVYAVPKEIIEKESAAKKLGTLLDMETSEVLQKISGAGSFAMIKKQIEDEVASRVKAAQIEGIYMQEQDVRYYPEKDLASQVIGFLGFKENSDIRLGQYGVEGKFEKHLAGLNGILDADTDPSGQWITSSSRSFVPATDGDDIYLTIDPAIQFKVQEILKKSVKEHEAESGSVLILDPKTGAVLAMANEPVFDLNEYGKVSDPAIYNNRNLSGDYEPGSIFKPITMAAALNEKKVTPQTTYVDQGFLQIDDKQIKNSDPEPKGEQNMIQVMQQSLNTGAVFAQQQVGNETFRKYVERFGFGKVVNFDLSGQVKGDLNNLNRKGDVFFATASYGQGITVTPIQMAQAFTAIANGGKLVTPYVVDKIVHPDGSEDVNRPEEGREIIENQTAAQVSAMLVDVVENGHGKRAAVPGYYIAGKTGTAQVAYQDRQGYNPDKFIGSFIGFGPVDNPRFLAIVRIDNPKGSGFAETTAAPAFGEIAAFILNYLQVAPTR